MKISEIVESRGHKVLSTWFKNRELQDKFAKGELDIPTPQQRKNYDDARDTVKNKKVKEADTPLRDLEDYEAKRQTLLKLQQEPHLDKESKKEIIRRLIRLEKQRQNLGT